MNPALEKAMDAAEEAYKEQIYGEGTCRDALTRAITAYHASLPSDGDVARYRELAIQRITYTHDEHGTAKLSAALHLTQQALAEAAAALTASEAERESMRRVLERLDARGGLGYAVHDEIRRALGVTP